MYHAKRFMSRKEPLSRAEKRLVLILSSLPEAFFVKSDVLPLPLPIAVKEKPEPHPERQNVIQGEGQSVFFQDLVTVTVNSSPHCLVIASSE